jgi:hypothetical protein
MLRIAAEQQLTTASYEPEHNCGSFLLALFLGGLAVMIYYTNAVRTNPAKLFARHCGILGVESPLSGSTGAGGRERRPSYNPAHCVAVSEDGSPLG